MQLQQYVNQVNAVANFEYYQGIGQRCGFWQPCMQDLGMRLQYWYAHQSALVNQWYNQIVFSCAASSNAGGQIASDSFQPNNTEAKEAVEELDLDDEDKTVAIVIPDTPAGFQ